MNTITAQTRQMSFADIQDKTKKTIHTNFE